MIPPARRWAAVTVVVAAALCAVACSRPDRSDSAAAPPATVPSPETAFGGADVRDLRAGVGGAAFTPTTEPAVPTTKPVIAPPRRVVIPSIGVEASIVDLGLTDDGALETPTDFDVAGWWAGGTVADEAGPTVIVGHVDDHNGPAVFFRLQELEQGDEVVVIDDLGREQPFRVVDKGLYDKDSFPTERVYGASAAPTLRLVTCGGEFDRSERSYESNWVVYAVAA